MATRALSNPQVEVNNQNIAIVPNSLTYDGGEGEVNVRSASAGGNSIQTVHTVNAETKIGKVMFDVYVTPELDALINEWKNQPGENTISFSENVGEQDFVRTFDGMSLMNPIERSPTADGVASLEFAGDPMVVSR